MHTINSSVRLQRAVHTMDESSAQCNVERASGESSARRASKEGEEQCHELELAIRESWSIACYTQTVFLCRAVQARRERSSAMKWREQRELWRVYWRGQY